jgi:hypothetical protein
MSYTFPTKLYPIAADVDALATFLAQRQSDSGTTNGGIVASGGSPIVPQMGVDAAGLGLAYLKGQADALKCALGYQGTLYDGFPTTTTATGSFGNLVSTSFTPPIAQTYELIADIKVFNTSAGGTAKFRWVIGGTPLTPPSSAVMTINTAFQAFHLTFRQFIPFAAASSTTVVLQWLTTSGTLSMNAGTEGLVIVARGA